MALEGRLSEVAVRYLYPVLALVLLTFAALVMLGFFRFRAIAQRTYPKGYFRLLRAPAGAELPSRAEAAARNVINLFEVPVLFYALVPLLLVTGVQDDLCLGLLWAFVAFRYLHTLIHVTVNRVRWRFSAYLFAALSLLGAWLRFASAVLLKM